MTLILPEAVKEFSLVLVFQTARKSISNEQTFYTGNDQTLSIE